MAQFLHTINEVWVNDLPFHFLFSPLKSRKPAKALMSQLCQDPVLKSFRMKLTIFFSFGKKNFCWKVDPASSFFFASSEALSLNHNVSMETFDSVLLFILISRCGRSQLLWKKKRKKSWEAFFSWKVLSRWRENARGFCLLVQVGLVVNLSLGFSHTFVANTFAQRFFGGWGLVRSS